MIKIICHRGWWKRKKQQNSLAAIEMALQEFDGVEIDLRSLGSQLVISHDPPKLNSPMPLMKELLQLGLPKNKWWALNIKQDGLLPLLKPLLKQLSTHHAFCFDLSGPEAMLYLKAQLPVFQRWSDYESPSFSHRDISGTVIDAFTAQAEKKLWHSLDQQLPVMLISPELHGRPHLSAWREYRRKAARFPHDILLCTDHPQSAQDFFL